MIFQDSIIKITFISTSKLQIFINSSSPSIISSSISFITSLSSLFVKIQKNVNQKAYLSYQNGLQQFIKLLKSVLLRLVKLQLKIYNRCNSLFQTIHTNDILIQEQQSHILVLSQNLLILKISNTLNKYIKISKIYHQVLNNNSKNNNKAISKILYIRIYSQSLLYAKYNLIKYAFKQLIPYLQQTKHFFKQNYPFLIKINQLIKIDLEDLIFDLKNHAKYELNGICSDQLQHYGKELNKLEILAQDNEDLLELNQEMSIKMINFMQSGTKNQEQIKTIQNDDFVNEFML